MDWERIKGIALEVLKKYRYAAVILLTGILLLIIPSPKQEKNPQPQEVTVQETVDLQTELENLLTKLEGAGRVKVLLTKAAGEEISYQVDENREAGDNSQTIRKETIVITGADRNQSGLIRRVDPPVYLGAVVLSQGADSASVRLAIMEAVKSATGLPANKIAVLKMK